MLHTIPYYLLRASPGTTQSGEGHCMDLPSSGMDVQDQTHVNVTRVFLMLHRLNLARVQYPCCFSFPGVLPSSTSHVSIGLGFVQYLCWCTRLPHSVNLPTSAHQTFLNLHVHMSSTVLVFMSAICCGFGHHLRVGLSHIIKLPVIRIPSCQKSHHMHVVSHHDTELACQARMTQLICPNTSSSSSSSSSSSKAAF